MKKIASAVLGLSLSLAVAGLSFAQAPAASPAKDGATTTAPAKKHVKRHKKTAVKAETPAAPAPATK